MASALLSPELAESCRPASASAEATDQFRFDIKRCRTSSLLAAISLPCFFHLRVRKHPAVVLFGDTICFKLSSTVGRAA